MCVCVILEEEVVAGPALGVFPFEIQREMEKSFPVCFSFQITQDKIKLEYMYV